MTLIKLHLKSLYQFTAHMIGNNFKFSLQSRVIPKIRSNNFSVHLIFSKLHYRNIKKNIPSSMQNRVNVYVC